MSQVDEDPRFTEILKEQICPIFLMKVAGNMVPSSPGVMLPVLVNMIMLEVSHWGREERENSKLSWYSGPQAGRVASILLAEKLPDITEMINLLKLYLS